MGSPADDVATDAGSERSSLAPFPPGRPVDPAQFDAVDELERRGMRAGDTSLDHGTFRAAATVAPVDFAAGVRLAVPDGDVAEPDRPVTTLIEGAVFGEPESDDGEPMRLRADVLVPTHPDAPEGGWPVVVFVPGGGFVRSPRAAALRRRAVVAAAGFVVVSVEYRTLRHGTAFDGADDVASAVAWVWARAAEFGGDPDRIALWGESAGGYLSALAVTTGRATGVRCVVDTFGLTDLAQVAADFDEIERARHHTPEITEAKYVLGRTSGKSIDDDPDEMQRANPVAQVSGDEPPFLLFHGSDDGLVSPSQTQRLHRALLDHGVDSRRFVVEGAGHYGPEWSSSVVLDIVVEHLHTHLTLASHASGSGT